MRSPAALVATLRRPWANAARHLAVRPLRVACVVLPAALFGGLAWLDHGIEIARARESVANTTDAMAEHAVTVVQTIDLVLARVRDHIAGQDWSELASSRETHDFLARLKGEFPQIESVFLVGPDGINQASSRAWPLPRYDVGQREYFRAARTASSDRVQISAPFNGRMAGTRAFVISRPLFRNGRFDGLVAVTVWPQYFETFYDTLVDDPAASAAALVRDDGALLVRFPELPHQTTWLPVDGPLMSAVRPDRDSGVFVSRNRITGHRQLSAWRRVRDLPLIVNYSLDRSVYMASWALHSAVLAVCTLLLSSALLAAEHISRRQTERDRDALRRLVAETERRRRAEAAAQQSQKMEAIGRLTGGVAHDFNNLLTAILGSLELVLRQEENPRRHRLLRTAFEAAERGARLTAQMLSFSRKQEVAVQPVDANRTIRGMRDLLTRTLGPEVKLHCALQDGLSPVLADPAQLELALLNLAVNARDAMPGGGDLTIRTEPACDDTGAGVAIVVADTGEGMTEDVRTRALEPFFTTKGPGRGTGLGLSMVYGFVTEVGGALAIDSAPGQGTTVRLLLREAASLPAAEAAPPPALAAMRPIRVLLVDDDAAVRLSTRSMLEDLGHTVQEADGGPAALAVLAEDRCFDLVLLDYAMPLMNGAQAATAITRLWPAAPLLFMTGYVENDGLRPWSSQGYRTLHKPFSALELAAAVQHATSRVEAAAEG
jgi:signal transduction histidine kinase/ActR/RegA family two-component response regulator